MEDKKSGMTAVVERSLATSPIALPLAEKKGNSVEDKIGLRRQRQGSSVGIIQNPVQISD
jgi:hypothetical protein